MKIRLDLSTLRRIIDAVPNFVFLKDEDSNFLLMNRSMAEFYGHDAADIIGAKRFDVNRFQEDVEGYINDDRRVVEEGIVLRTAPERKRSPEGQVRILQTVKMPIDIGHGRTGVLGVSHDITELQLAREALESEKELLSATLASIAEGVITSDINGSITMVNENAARMLGVSRDAVKGSHIHDVFRLHSEHDAVPIRSYLDNVLGGSGRVELERGLILTPKRGEELRVAVSVSPITHRNGSIGGCVIAFRDVTEASRTEMELQKAQKLESVGRLAGGIAHDFNNIMTAVLGNISLSKIASLDNEEVSVALSEAEEAVRAAKALTRQLMVFAEGGVPVRESASLDELVRESAAFVLRGSNVRAEVSVQDGLWPVHVDRKQVGQALQNIVLNAMQAMPEGGVVRIDAANASRAEYRDAEHAAMVKVRVTDDGLGIPRKYVDRVFDPYFTTKPHATGLGLSIAYSVVRNHGGRIDVQTRHGEGTTFVIYLPAKAEAVEEATAAPPGERLEGKRILVMDDEHIVRQVLGKMLTRLGCIPTLAADGDEAIYLYRKALETGKPFDLVIMDLTVPGGMGGRDAAQRIHEMDPEARVLVSSGYSQDPVMTDYRSFGFLGIITKPYTVSELDLVLSATLQG